MELIYGTQNKAKLQGMQDFIKPLNLQIKGIADVLDKVPEVNESGNNPLENACIKAKAYYKHINRPVFSCDSGLFIKGLEDEKQPGVHVRRYGGNYANDEEMIRRYSKLASNMGGKCVARYINAICLITEDGSVFKHMGEDISSEEFIITNIPHKKRVNGFPLDSLSIEISSGCYYYDIEKNSYLKIDKGFQAFFKKHLNI